MENSNYILFENYLSGALTDNEIVSFKKALKNDTTFKEEFNTYKELSGFLEHKFEKNKNTIEFKGNLKNISNSYFEKLEPKKKNSTLKLWQYAIAASFVFFFGIHYFNSSSMPIYNNFRSYDTIDMMVRSTPNELLNKAENAFNSKSFSEAEDYFTQLLAIDIDNTELKLYKAFSQIELNKFKEADAALEELSKGKSAYKNKATWYLALSKLKQKNYTSCSKLLKTISNDADNYQNVKKLLQKLE